MISAILATGEEFSFDAANFAFYEINCLLDGYIEIQRTRASLDEKSPAWRDDLTKRSLQILKRELIKKGDPSVFGASVSERVDLLLGTLYPNSKAA